MFGLSLPEAVMLMGLQVGGLVLVGVLLVRVFRRLTAAPEERTGAHEAKALQARVERMEEVVLRMSTQMDQLMESQEFTARVLSERTDSPRDEGRARR